MKALRIALLALLVAPIGVAQEDETCPTTYPPEPCEEASIAAGATPSSFPPPDCLPCYDYDDVAAALTGGCGVTASCTQVAADPNYYLLAACDPGGGAPVTVIGIYLALSDGSCSRDDVFGSVTIPAGGMEPGSWSGRCTDLNILVRNDPALCKP